MSITVKLTVKEIITKSESNEVIGMVLVRTDGTELTLNSLKPVGDFAVGDILVVNADTLDGEQVVEVIATVNATDLAAANKVTKVKNGSLTGKNKGCCSNKPTLSLRD